MSRLERLNEAIKGLARPIAKEGIKGVRAGFGNLFASPLQRRQATRGYGSGAYSGSYYQMAQLFKELRADPTGLSLAAEETEIIYNCLMVRCSAITGLEWGIYPKAGKRDSNSKVENTPFHRMIQYAQSEYDQDFFFLWELSLGVHGEVFYEKLPRPDGLPGGLRYLNRIAIDPFIFAGHVDYYSYSDDAGMTNFRPDELIRDSLPNLLDDFSGSSDVARALNKVNSDRGRSKHVLAYFRNGAKIGGWLTLRQGAQINEKDYERLKKDFREHLSSADNAYKWGFLPAELEAKSSENAPFDHHKELEDSDVQRMHWAMHVPPVLTGAIAASDPLSSLGTLDAAKAFFYENYVQSRAKHIATVVNEKILPWLWMDGYELVFGVDKVLSTMRQTAERSSKAQGEFKATGITHGEMRIQMGYDPDPAIADMYWYDGVGLIPKTEVANIWKAKLLIAPSVYNSELITGKPLPQPVDPNQVVPDNTGGEPVSTSPTAPDANKDLVPAAAPPVGKSMCAMLMMPNHPDLMSLQNRVKAYLGDEVACQWNDPATFHVTMLYAPTATDAQMKAFADQLAQMELPELKLNIGSLGVFENVGEYPVHFRIRQNADLLAAQSAMYEAAKSAGILMSSYSQPGMYQPHITMGYATSKPKAVTFKSKLSVVPEALHLAADDDVVLKLSLLDEDEPEPPPETAKPPFKQKYFFAANNTVAGPPPQADALDELRAWQVKVDNARRAGKSLVELKFKAYMIRDDIADGIRMALAECSDDKELIRMVFDRAREFVAYRAIQSTRLDFENDFDDLVAAARADEASKRSAASKLRFLLNKYGKQAYNDGLVDGGIPEPKLTAKDKDVIGGLLADQSTFVSNFISKLFDGGITDAQASERAAMWYRGSIEPFYNAGRNSADANGMYELVGDDGEESCKTCQALKGQVHLWSDWVEQRLLPGIGGNPENYECGAWRCDHRLVRVNRAESGDWLGAAA